MITDKLHCIDLDQPKQRGFRRFISAWLLREENFTVLVDPGPLSTIEHLVGELRRLGVGRIDYILLTHIHIDHAGGTGRLLEYYPAAQVVCHPDGVKHMVDPRRLWQGSLKVLGSLAQTYGEIIAVPEKNILTATALGDTGISVHHTPGHAVHHLCFSYKNLLFGGEVCGVHSEVEQGIYMRPATPPRFILEVALESIDKMMALKPEFMVIAHHGLVQPALEYLRIGRRQLLLWLQAVALSRTVASPQREKEIRAWLLDHDGVFANINQLPEDIRAREDYFMANSLRGMIDYCNGLSEKRQMELAAASWF